jgi:hypothetical protein
MDAGQTLPETSKITGTSFKSNFVIKFMYQQNQKIAITTAVGISVGFYFIFAYALQLNLPVGPLGL